LGKPLTSSTAEEIPRTLKQTLPAIEGFTCRTRKRELRNDVSQNCFAGLLGALVVSAGPALAAQTVPYTPEAFETAMAAGKPVLVEIHASWCPICKKQAPILSDLEKTPKFNDLVVIHVDFDTQKDAVREFGAQMQSALIVFKDGKQAGRSVGDTNPDSMAALLDKAV
jgi:thiol-disulfide isomerase/thioredoxin